MSEAEEFYQRAVAQHRAGQAEMARMDIEYAAINDALLAIVALQVEAILAPLHGFAPVLRESHPRR